MDSNSTLAAALAGRYDIEGELGRGGMATVYLARDIRHQRQVAVKVLDPELGAVLGGERFLSEIRVTANLQHPNLLPLFDSGEAGGLLFYVMPFVSGESLRHRLDREKQLPIEEAVRIATAIAGALDHAHRQGVVHRDLKPENILLHDGQPLVADFGIALAVSNAGGQRVTQTGLSLGTPQYMSPEQATGDRSLDARTDIYSLGAVTYEMLAGEPPHQGGTAQAIIARLMTEDPRPLTAVRRNVPNHVAAAVHCSLEKLPADRFGTAKEFADALAGTAPVPHLPHGVASPSTTSSRRRLALLALPWVLAIASATAALLVFRGGHVAPQTVRFTLDVPGVRRFTISPDGERIAYSARRNGTPMLFQRRLDEEEAHVVPGTESADVPFYSADSRMLGFVTSDRTFKKVPVVGGPVATIARPGRFGGITWGAKDVIVYSLGSSSGLWKVSASGGEPQQFTTPDAKQAGTQRDPSFMPDGESVLFASNNRLAIASLDGSVTLLDQQGVSARMLGTSHIMFTSAEGILSVVPFDARRKRFTGAPVAMIDNVAGASIARNGTLVYRRGEALSTIAIAGPDGVKRLRLDARRYRSIRLSPDGSLLAAEVQEPGKGRNLWVYDLASGTPTRLTSDGHDGGPVWSPDGRQIAFTRQPQGTITADVYVVASDGSGSPRLLSGAPGGQRVRGWNPDGTLVLDDDGAGERAPGIFAMKIGQAPRELLSSSAYVAAQAAPSPDGRWLAFMSNESGAWQVFIRPFDGGGKQQLSTDGGTQPVWSRDGRTLYYRDRGQIVAVSITANGAAPIIGARRVAFGDSLGRSNIVDFAAHGGRELLIAQSASDDEQIVVVVNWLEEVKRRLMAPGQR